MLFRVSLLSLLSSKTFPKQILHNPATTKKVMIGISRKSNFDKYGTESVKNNTPCKLWVHLTQGNFDSSGIVLL